MGLANSKFYEMNSNLFTEFINEVKNDKINSILKELLKSSDLILENDIQYITFEMSVYFNTLLGLMHIHLNELQMVDFYESLKYIQVDYQKHFVKISLILFKEYITILSEELDNIELQPIALKTKSNKGYVKLFVGPMFSGKTSSLIHSVSELAIQGYDCLIIKCIIDKRYEKDCETINSLATHNGCDLKPKSHKNIMIEMKEKNYFDKLKESELSELFKDYDVVGIDEPHFLSNDDSLYKIINYLVDKLDKIIIISGINNWANQNSVKCIDSIITKCKPEIVEWKNSICYICKRANATRTIVISKSIQEQLDMNENILNGGKEEFKSICRHCYNNKEN